jgi:thymidylate synthase
LVRNRALHTVYFSRGQDAFQKFYADGLCLGLMGQKVAEELGLRPGNVTGFIASSHVYDRDLPAIGRMLARAQDVLGSGARTGRQ